MVKSIIYYLTTSYFFLLSMLCEICENSTINKSQENVPDFDAAPQFGVASNFQTQGVDVSVSPQAPLLTGKAGHNDKTVSFPFVYQLASCSACFINIVNFQQHECQGEFNSLSALLIFCVNIVFKKSFSECLRQELIYYMLISSITLCYNKAVDLFKDRFQSCLNQILLIG